MSTATVTEMRPQVAAPGPGRLAAVAASARAESMRLRKWPALWVMVGIWLLLNLTFAYIFNYVTYVTGSENFATEGGPASRLLANLLPAAVPSQLTGGMPMFGGAIMLILGALTAGSGYGWGTWKTVMMQGPSRLAAFGGTLVSVAAVVVGVVTATLAFDFATSLIIAGVEGQPIQWPGSIETLQSYGGGLLIFGMWAAAGVLIGTLTRSPALAVGLGLVWTMAIENLLRGVANLLSSMEYITDYLPGTAAGSLSGALGASGGSDGAPGVLTILDGELAAILTAGYLVAFATTALLLVRRRDVT